MSSVCLFFKQFCYSYLFFIFFKIYIFIIIFFFNKIVDILGIDSRHGSRHFGTVDIMGIDILGIDIMGVDILGIDIPAPTHFLYMNRTKPQV